MRKLEDSISVNVPSADWYSKPAAERALLSLCLQNYSTFIDVSSKLFHEDFLDPGNRALFITMLSVHSLGTEEFDLPTVISFAENMGVLEDIGGYKYIDALFRSEISQSNLEVYVKQVLDASLLFKLERVLRLNVESVKTSVSENKTASEVMSSVENQILNLSLDTLKVDDGQDLVAGLEERLKEFESNPAAVRGIRCGFEVLDRTINGFKPGTLSILAARPKTGKSTLLLNWGIHICLHEKLPVLYLDTEMSKEEQQTRALSIISGVPERVILNGLYINDENVMKSVYYGVEIMNKMKFIHKYTPGYRIEELKGLIRKYKAKNNIGVFIYDYIKMTDMEDKFNETQTLGYITSGLKDTAGILGIAGISAVQLNRGAEGKSLVGSGDIADSDKILRYCSTLMAMSRKTRAEIDKEGGRSGTHRLQILDSRGSRSLYSGIDLEVNFPTLTIKEARAQSSAAFLEQKQLEEEVTKLGGR